MAPFFIALGGCVNKRPSTEEYNLAKVAFRAAQESEAKRYSPKVFSQARNYLKRGERAYQDRYFEKSAEYFRKSRYYSEKAENISRLKMFRQGEMGP